MQQVIAIDQQRHGKTFGAAKTKSVSSMSCQGTPRPVVAALKHNLCVIPAAGRKISYVSNACPLAGVSYELRARSRLRRDCCFGSMVADAAADGWRRNG